MQVPQNQTLVSALLNSIAPNPQLGASCQGNWPADAEYAVDYRDRDRQFPQVDHGVYTEFFSSMEEFTVWKQATAKWVRGTDYDFSRHYSLFSWDLGPTLVESSSI